MHQLIICLNFQVKEKIQIYLLDLQMQMNLFDFTCQNQILQICILTGKIQQIHLKFCFDVKIHLKFCFDMKKRLKLCFEVKGVFSKPSGKCIVAPNPCFLS